MNVQDIEWWLKDGIEKDNLVLFIGAGMSYRLRYENGLRPFPLWKDLIFEIVNEIPTANRAKHIAELNGSHPDLLKVLDDYEKQDRQIREFLKSRYHDKINWEEIRSPIHEKLYRLSPKIITTNYDCLFERLGFFTKGTDCYDKSDLKKVGYSAEYLFKIHGCVGIYPNRLILFRKDYEALYGRDDYNEENPGVRKLKDILYSNTILFLGVSLDDPYINHVLRTINDESDGYSANNYLFLTTEKDLSQEGVQLIKRTHYEELDSFIDKLLELKNSFNKGLRKKAKMQETLKIDERDSDLYLDFEQYKPYFKGRTRELQEFKQIFDDSRFICLHGLGGIGKTNFISKFIRDNNVPGTVFIDGRLSPNLETLVLKSGHPQLLKVENRTDAWLFDVFHKQLELERKTLVIENYQDLKDSSIKSFFAYCKNRLINCRIIIVSRKDEFLDSVSSASFQLRGLDQNSAYELMLEKIKEWGSKLPLNVDEKQLRLFCNNLNFHPKAIELAIPLIQTKTSVRNLIADLKKEDDGEKLTSILLDIAFKDDDTTEMERETLKRFSVFKTPIPYEVFEFILPGVSVSTINGVVRKNLMEKKGDYYQLHPLVRELIPNSKEELKQLNNKAASYYLSKVDMVNDICDLTLLAFNHFIEAENYHEAEVTLGKGFDYFNFFGRLDQVKGCITVLEQQKYTSTELEYLKAQIADYTGNTLESIEILKSIYANPLTPRYLKLTCRISLLAHSQKQVGNSLLKVDSSDGLDTIKELLLIRKELRDDRSDAGNTVYRNCLFILFTQYGNIGKIEKAFELHKELIGITPNDEPAYFEYQIKLCSLLLSTGHSKNWEIAYEILTETLEVANKYNYLEFACNCNLNLGKYYIVKRKADKALVHLFKSLNTASSIGDMILETQSAYFIGFVYLNLLEGKASEALGMFLRAYNLIIKTSFFIPASMVCCFIGTIEVSHNASIPSGLLFFIRGIAYAKATGDTKSLQSNLSLLNEAKKIISKNRYETEIAKAMDRLDESLKGYVRMQELL